MKLKRQQETVHFTEVGCSAPVIRLGSAQDVLRIKVDSGPKQSFQIKKIGNGEHILAETPLIPAGESYLWEPTTKGTYTITSTIYYGLATTIIVGLSPTLPLNNNSNSISTKGLIAAVDDCVRFPLAPLSSRASLLGVSTSSPSNSTTTPSSSSYGTPAASTTTSSSSISSGSGGAAFRLPRRNFSHDTTPSSVSAVSLRSRAQRFEEDDEEYDFEELAIHPSRPGLVQRRGVSVGTDTSEHRAEQQQQWHQVASSRRAAGNGHGTAVQRPPRRQQLAGLSQPFRGTPDIDERSPSPIQPCSPLAGPHTASSNNNSNNNNNSGAYGGGGDSFPTTYTTRTGAARYGNEQPVKILDISRHNGVVPANGGYYSNNGVGGGVGSNNNNNNVYANADTTLHRCARCQKDYACLSNQQRCMASHIKRGKQARHPAIAPADQLISFWNGLNQEERFDIIDYSHTPEATNAFYVLYASQERSTLSSSSSSPLYSTAADPASKLENAGKELTKTLESSDKISEVSGEQFLKILEDAAEGTLLLGSANGGGSSRDASGYNALCSSSSSLLPSFLESTVLLSSVLGARLITALKAEQKKKSELALFELQAVLVAEEQAEEQKKKKTKKKNTKKNKNKKKDITDASREGTGDAGDDASAEVEKEVEIENGVTAVHIKEEGQDEEEEEEQEQEENKEQENKERENKKNDIGESILFQRPVIDSCLEETEVAVGKATKLHNGTDVSDNGTIHVEDSADGLVEAVKVEATPAAEKIHGTDGCDQGKEQEEEDIIEVVPSTGDVDAVPSKKVVVKLASKEADSNSFIVDFGDDHEEKEQVMIESVAVAVADATVVVEKYEKKGKAKKVVATVAAPNTVPDAVVLESEQQPQQLSKAQRRRLAAKRKKEQAMLAAAAAELVPGEPPRVVVVSTSNGTSTPTSLPTSIERPQVPPPVQQQQQQGKQPREKKNQHQQQQADPEAGIKEQFAVAPDVLVASEAVAVKEEEKTVEVEENTSCSSSIAAVASPADPAPVPAAPAMPAYYGGYGGPGYQHMGYYPHVMAPYNPMFAHHAYPPMHPQLPPPVDADAPATGASVGAVLPLPPPGVPAALYGSYGSYMMPPPHLHPGMMQQQLPGHPMGLPVMATPAAAAASSPLPDGVALGVPVEYEQKPVPRQVKDQDEQLQQGQNEEGPVDAATAEKEDQDQDRFKKMLWEAQLRSVNGDVALLCRLTAQLHKKAAAEFFSDPGKVSTKRATFDVEAAKGYFEKISRELIGESDTHMAATEANTTVVAAPQLSPPGPAAAAAAAAKPLPSSSISFSSPVAVPPPKNPYLHAALSRTLSTNTNNSSVPSGSPNGAFEQQKPKKKVRGPRHKNIAPRGAPYGVEAPAMPAHNTASNTGSEAHHAPPSVPPPDAPGVGGGGGGGNGKINRDSLSRQNASSNRNNGNTVHDARRRNNNSNSSAAITRVHADQRLQGLSSIQQQQQPQQRSFLATAAGGPPRFPKLDVPLKSSNNNSNIDTTGNESRPPVHGTQKRGGGEWKIQAHA